MELFEALYTTRAMRRMQTRKVPDDPAPGRDLPSAGCARQKPAHEVTFIERFGQRPTWTVPTPLWP